MPEVRFWSWVDVNGPDQCWMWRGATDRAGYGAFRLDGGARKAHRVAMVMVGAAPGSAHALHRCHNPACCNPAHLRPGSDADNAADKVRAGRARGPAGLRNAGAVLRPEKVAAIRLMHAGGASQRAIARAVGVTRDAVRGVVDGRTWRHVG